MDFSEFSIGQKIKVQAPNEDLPPSAFIEPGKVFEGVVVSADKDSVYFNVPSNDPFFSYWTLKISDEGCYHLGGKHWILIEF